jgi:hypothetical protein
VTKDMHTDEEIEKAAVAFEHWADNLHPDKATVIATPELRAIADAADQVAAAEARLTEAVAIARARGWSWNMIAVPLRVSRQAARQRFARAELA